MKNGNNNMFIIPLAMRSMHFFDALRLHSFNLFWSILRKKKRNKIIGIKIPEAFSIYTHTHIYVNIYITTHM